MAAGTAAFATHDNSAVHNFGASSCASVGTGTVAVCTSSGLYVLARVCWCLCDTVLAITLHIAS